MKSIRIFGVLSVFLCLNACGDDPCAGTGMTWGARSNFNTVDMSCGGGSGSNSTNRPPCSLLTQDPDCVVQ